MIAVIDYGVGNLFSVEKALTYVGAEVEVTHDAKKIAQADRLVLPGVGAFGDCMRRLESTGLIPVLFEGSDESPGVAGLGIFSGRVRRIEAPQLKIPHMGWNSLEFGVANGNIDIFQDVPTGAYVYFVHSYHAMPVDLRIIAAKTTYGESVTAAVAKGNVHAVQFHPEKSGTIGSTILKNFVEG